jgi:4-amino-4-deoxy-L-arabinose transferase-like glycosyltransferase
MVVRPRGREFALFAFALALRLAYVLVYPQLPLAADAADYQSLAGSIEAGRGFVNQAGRVESGRAPLYPYFLAATYSLLGDDPVRVRLVQSVLGAATALLTLALARRYFSERVAWIAAVGVAVHPALVAYSGLVLTETLATVLACLIALSASLLWRTRTIPRSLATGAVLGLAALCRAEWITVAFGMIVLFVISPSGKREGERVRVDLRTPLLVSLAFACVLAPWTTRNHRVLGAFVPVSTDGWRAAWIATYPAGWLEWRAEEPLLSIEGPPDTPPLERARRFRRAALQNLREAPLSFVRMCAHRVALLWVGGHSNVIAGLESPTATSRGWVLAVKLFLLGLNTGVILLAFVGIWISRNRWRDLLPLLVCMALPVATYVLLVAVPRYHLPLLPLLLPFAAEAALSRRLRELALELHAADTRFTDRFLSGTPLHPAFWVYRRIRGAVAGAAQAHARGLLLDIGCGLKPYEAAFAGRVSRHLGLEPSPSAGYLGNRADLVGDAACLPVAEATFDTVLCTEVLEHVRAPGRVVAEIARVLRPGGVAIVTVPFVYPVHDRQDYQRFTGAGLRELFAEPRFEVVELRPLSFPVMTLCIMAAIVIHELCFVRSRYGYALSVPLRPLLWVVVGALNVTGWVGEAVCRATSFPFNHLLVARRRA